MDLFTVGIDLGKTTFHLVGMSHRGDVVVRKQYSRIQLLRFTANLKVKLLPHLHTSDDYEVSVQEIKFSCQVCWRRKHSRSRPSQAQVQRPLEYPFCIPTVGFYFSPYPKLLILVAPSGIEPELSALRGPRVNQLHHGATEMGWDAPRVVTSKNLTDWSGFAKPRRRAHDRPSDRKDQAEWQREAACAIRR
jgi:hypothetical protein